MKLRRFAFKDFFQLLKAGQEHSVKCASRSQVERRWEDVIGGRPVQRGAKTIRSTVRAPRAGGGLLHDLEDGPLSEFGRGRPKDGA